MRDGCHGPDWRPSVALECLEMRCSTMRSVSNAEGWLKLKAVMFSLSTHSVDLLKSGTISAIRRTIVVLPDPDPVWVCVARSEPGRCGSDGMGLAYNHSLS